MEAAEDVKAEICIRHFFLPCQTKFDAFFKSFLALVKKTVRRPVFSASVQICNLGVSRKDFQVKEISVLTLFLNICVL